MNYLMTDRYSRSQPDGSFSVERKPDREVNDVFVQNFVEAVDFFESLGGSEMVSRRQGRIYVTSISPDRKTTRETVFTPIKDGPRL